MRPQHGILSAQRHALRRLAERWTVALLRRHRFVGSNHRFPPSLWHHSAVHLQKVWHCERRRPTIPLVYPPIGSALVRSHLGAHTLHAASDRLRWESHNLWIYGKNVRHKLTISNLPIYSRPQQVVEFAGTFIAYMLALSLVVKERFYKLPSTPSYGHGLVLLVTWMLQLIVENLALMNMKSDEWQDLSSRRNQIELMLFGLRYVSCLFIFVLGLKAPGITRPAYDHLSESGNDVSLRCVFLITIALLYYFQSQSIINFFQLGCHLRETIVLSLRSIGFRSSRCD